VLALRSLGEAVEVGRIELPSKERCVSVSTKRVLSERFERDAYEDSQNRISSSPMSKTRVGQSRISAWRFWRPFSPNQASSWWTALRPRRRKRAAGLPSG